MSGTRYRAWRCEPPRPLPGGKLVALRRLRRQPLGLKGWVVGALAPVGVVLCTADGQRALGMDGEALDLDVLRQEVPGLADLLAACPGAPSA